MDRHGKQQQRVKALSDGSLQFNSNYQFVGSFKAMSAMRKSRELCDVVLIVDGEQIHAHRIVLSSLSPYFKAMFTGDMAESKQREITINGIDADTLESIVDYAYTANIKITEDNVQLLLPAASILQFEEIRQVCSDFMLHRLSTDNCLGVRIFAEIHGCPHLESAASVFSQSHFPEVSKKEEFLNFTVDQLKELMSKDQLNVQSEFEVFEALMNWIEQDKESRQKYIADLVNQVRLPLLSVKELLQDVGKNPLVLGDSKCVELLLGAVEHHLLPSAIKVCLLCVLMHIYCALGNCTIKVFYLEGQQLCGMYTVLFTLHLDWYLVDLSSPHPRVSHKAATWTLKLHMFHNNPSHVDSPLISAPRSYCAVWPQGTSDACTCSYCLGAAWCLCVRVN